MTHREEFKNDQSPDDEDFSDKEDTKKSSHNFTHTKDENLVEYVAVPKGGTLSQGKKIGEGMHFVSENIEEEREGGEGQEADTGVLVPIGLSHRWLRNAGVGTGPVFGKTHIRSDALTSRPLDLEEEDETRKLETSKWLESHFGSEDSFK
jgi:hypothetical protein